MSPHGHTISVSDVWLVAHYYGILFTTLGEIENLDLLQAKTVSGDRISCHLIVKCTGYWKNEKVREVLGFNSIFINQVVRRNLAY